ncbi:MULTISPECIES: tRNA (adenosine(37)-N6)-threonylcarbamoyltransferase complex ATPase subunit type 1 TsaE [Myroides]|uniref:tRNA threonylcarbamoyladenosine biosynthesis protein TsaE n=1 Tax=Myroides albus TaxID=2562892 RepID=A0A6I3LMG8_9FLAO|nr:MULTISPECIES: tRNA (adenosine(37)-N6)-threonylcarbamoyltransferase complex ATPase subunit type 1 TsaE [Myroides]MTG97781.1 tRNA (adenosine(37)-N6)-threonylcarbamoyltransferase complex ATPase subunit type 1 TsaE [Myroides albus]MVX35535.1 tRNA (adenosine(37)-N6)-threonylcarbamoyltransferase complex ATPase subunit type 1 TsaE [Myroides sp. LoEW2-1]UVD79737.1 tRNA (adenosine(37)-N6)-threonylcarbamoyltransferase complex ATPase subunit type 1 TsaE [Myroides albus]
MEITFSLENIDQTAETVLRNIQNKVVLFDAEMGTGKTTFIKSLAKHLGVNDLTSSPTFSIVNEYHSATTSDIVYHFDLYRIEEEEEAYDMGMDEYLDSGNWCFIEWPEKTPNIIPEDHTLIEIFTLENGDRRLTLTNN